MMTSSSTRGVLRDAHRVDDTVLRQLQSRPDVEETRL
jgi:hypothetical protein